MVSNSQPRPIANLGAVTLLDMEQVAAISLEQLHNASEAAFLGIALYDAGFSAAWKGNRLDRDALRPIEASLSDQAAATGQAALYQASASDSVEPGVVAVIPLLIHGQSVGSLTLAWESAPPDGFDLRNVQI